MKSDGVKAYLALLFCLMQQKDVDPQDCVVLG